MVNIISIILSLMPDLFIFKEVGKYTTKCQPKSCTQQDMPTFAGKCSMSPSSSSLTIMFTMKGDITEGTFTTSSINLNSLHPQHTHLHFIFNKHIFTKSLVNLSSLCHQQMHLHFSINKHILQLP